MSTLSLNHAMWQSLSMGSCKKISNIFSFSSYLLVWFADWLTYWLINCQVTDIPGENLLSHLPNVLAFISQVPSIPNLQTQRAPPLSSWPPLSIVILDQMILEVKKQTARLGHCNFGWSHSHNFFFQSNNFPFFHLFFFFKLFLNFFLIRARAKVVC